jgi:hypothetical protein
MKEISKPQKPRKTIIVLDAAAAVTLVAAPFAGGYVAGIPGFFAGILVPIGLNSASNRIEKKYSKALEEYQNYEKSLDKYM